jgi:cytochrome c oxidase subunit 1/cytochrome c oxidase subunit I+III
MPKDSLAPLTTAFAATAVFVGLVFHAWWLAALGIIGIAASLLVWLWPERMLGQTGGVPAHG